MALDPLHEDVARIALALPEGQSFALAGGGAMLAYDLVDRLTHDVDLFTQTRDIAAMATALHGALTDRGYTVAVEQQVDTFARLDLTGPDGRTLTVDLAQDARLHNAVRLDLGPVIAAEDLIADKTLALWGRREARDLIDVDALATRYGHARLLELAAEKDPGFTPADLPNSIRAAAARPDEAFTGAGVTAGRLRGLRERAAGWAGELSTAATAAAITHNPTRSAVAADFPRRPSNKELLAARPQSAPTGSGPAAVKKQPPTAAR